jgi:hypothetical protein
MGWCDLQAKLGGFLSDELDLLLAVSFLVVFSAFVDVLLTILQHPINLWLANCYFALVPYDSPPCCHYANAPSDSSVHSSVPWPACLNLAASVPWLGSHTLTTTF